MKKKILVVSNVNKKSAALRYRVLYPLQLLEEEIDLLSFYSEKTYNCLGKKNHFYKIFRFILDFISYIFKILALKNSYSAIIVKNYCFPLFSIKPEKIIFTILKKKSNNFIYDIDDAIYLNQTRKNNKFFLRFRNAKLKVEFWINECGKISLSNHYIKNDLNNLIDGKKIMEHISVPYKKQYFENDNFLKGKDKKMIIWLGSKHTQKHLTLWENELILFLENNPDYKLVIIGADKSELEMFNLPNVFIKEWNLETEKKYMKKASFGLNPLEESEFEIRKSAFKVIQYYRAGIVPIVSNVGINVELVERFGGIIFDKSKKNFEKLTNSNFDAKDLYNSTKHLSLECYVEELKKMIKG